MCSMTMETKRPLKSRPRYQLLQTPTPNSHKRSHPHNNKNAESDTRPKTPTTLKTPFFSNNHITGVDITQRTIEVANVVVINNKRITTPVTFQFHPPRNSSNFSISRAHQNIFEALELLDPTLKFVTFHGTHIDTFDQHKTNTHLRLKIYIMK